MTDHDKKSLSLLSSLFAYPAHPWIDIKEMRRTLNEVCYTAIRDQVHSFLDYAEERSLEELAELYVITFDFSENSNLDLTSLLCPDDRKRGVVLANLKDIYHQAQLDMDSNELPDYLPLILEFLSVAGAKESKEAVSIVGPAMEKLWEQLKKNNSPYARILEACLWYTAAITGLQIPVHGGVS